MKVKKEHLEKMLQSVDNCTEEYRFDALQVIMVVVGYQQNINFGLNKKPLSIGKQSSECAEMIDKYIEENSKPHPNFDRTGVPDCIEVSLLHGRPVFSQ